MNAINTEALKEFGRVLLLGLVSWLLTEGVIGSIVNALGGSLDVTTKSVLVGIITSALKSADKWLHQTGKASEEETGDASKLTLGLTRF